MTFLAIIFILIGLGQLVRRLGGGSTGGSNFTLGTAVRYGGLARVAAKMFGR